MAVLARRMSGMVSGRISRSCVSHSATMASARRRFGTTSGTLAGVRSGRPSRAIPYPSSASMTRACS